MSVLLQKYDANCLRLETVEKKKVMTWRYCKKKVRVYP